MDPVWKYNFQSHIHIVHSTADVKQFKNMYELGPHTYFLSLMALFTLPGLQSTLLILRVTLVKSCQLQPVQVLQMTRTLDQLEVQ